ncbi:Iron/ascorbate family oxidoreductase [Handroanthus impetiginosus]|uniref:Iron/ascorbate family oxidoreductase n=1 Tax=Handroanthus impetiginosus TaxID=429701 RepID=A0A2G9G734_9LAMI|nr:Iron/ascorbate family oxidoreductase [Handroanthus impetiginosus]
MATNFQSIPLIDISPLVEKWNDPNMAQDEGVAEVVQQLAQACREAGFFYVKGHGIPDFLVKEIRSISRQFFHLPYEEKLKIKLSAATGYRGYQRVGENITKGVPDMHEAIDCYRDRKPGMYGDLGEVMEGCNEWYPSDPPSFKILMEDYVNRCTDLCRKIMRGIATALGSPMDAVEGDRAGDPFWVLRVIGYPVVCHANGKEMPKPENDVGLHFIVRNGNGEWISAIPFPGTFVCNIGDMLKPNFDAAIEPLDECVQKTVGTKKSQGAVYGKHSVS